MSNLTLIIKREFIARVRNKTFVVMTFLSPLIFVAMIGLITWLSTMNNDEVRHIGLFDQSGMFTADFKNSNNLKYTDYTHFSLQQAKDSTIHNELYGLLYIPKKGTSQELSNSIQFYAKEVFWRKNLKNGQSCKSIFWRSSWIFAHDVHNHLW